MTTVPLTISSSVNTSGSPSPVPVYAVTHSTRLLFGIELAWSTTVRRVGGLGFDPSTNRIVMRMVLVIARTMMSLRRFVITLPSWTVRNKTLMGPLSVEPRYICRPVGGHVGTWRVSDSVLCRRSACAVYDRSVISVLVSRLINDCLFGLQIDIPTTR